MKRSLLPIIKIFSILFVPGAIPIYLATLFAKKKGFNNLKTIKLRTKFSNNYHD